MLSITRLLYFCYWQGWLFTYHSLLRRILFIFFLFHPNHIEKCLWKTGKGSLSHKLELILFFIKGKNLLAAIQQWDNIQFFPCFIPILLSFLLSFISILLFLSFYLSFVLSLFGFLIITYSPKCSGRGMAPLLAPMPLFKSQLIVLNSYGQCWKHMWGKQIS
jgi:hypothetical protein